MFISTITQNGQATIPAEIRGIMSINTGDKIRFYIDLNKNVTIKKIHPLDLEFAKSVEATLSDEWNSAEDNEAYNDL